MVRAKQARVGGTSLLTLPHRRRAGEIAIGVITNPNSKKNKRVHDRAQRLEEIVGEFGMVRQTKSLEEIPKAIAEFKERGVEYFIADGGDGAFHWMLNSAAEALETHPAGLPAELPFTLPTNGGTIDYVAHCAGVRGRAEDILQKLVKYHRKGRPIPVSRMRSLIFEGYREVGKGILVPFKKVGFATAAAGIGNRFFSKYYQARVPSPKVIVEVATKLVLGTLIDATPLRRLVPDRWLDYARGVTRPHRVRVTVDGELLPCTDLTVCNIGAIQINLGGVFKCFTHADEEHLHIMVGECSPFGVIANIPRLATGRKLKDPKLFDRPAREIHLEALGDELLRPNVDGEFIDDVREMTVRLGPHFQIPRIEAKRHYGLAPRRDRASAARRKGFWSLDAWRKKRKSRPKQIAGK